MNLKTLKDLYAELEDCNDAMTEDEYELKILNKAVEKLKSGKAVFYTHEEFWEIVRKGGKEHG